MATFPSRGASLTTPPIAASSGFRSNPLTAKAAAPASGLKATGPSSTLSTLVRRATSTSTATPFTPGVSKFVGSAAPAPAASSSPPLSVGNPLLLRGPVGGRNPLGMGAPSVLQRLANSLNPSSPTSSNPLSIIPTSPTGAAILPPLSTPTADSGAPLALPGSPLAPYQPPYQSPYQPSPYDGGGGGGGGGGYNPSYDQDDDYGTDAEGNPLPAPVPPPPAMSTETKLLIGGGVVLGIGVLYALSKGHRS